MYVFLTLVPLSLSNCLFLRFSVIPHTFTCTVLPFTISPILFTESLVHCNDLRLSQSPSTKVFQSQTYPLFFCLLLTRRIYNPQQTSTIQRARSQGSTWMLLWVSGTLPIPLNSHGLAVWHTEFSTFTRGDFRFTRIFSLAYSTNASRTP